MTYSHNGIVRLAALDTLGSAGKRTHAAVINALAEAWIGGQHHHVRDIINGATTPVLKAAWLNDTRALLPNDNMKDAFDAFVTGRH